MSAVGASMYSHSQRNRDILRSMSVASRAKRPARPRRSAGGGGAAGRRAAVGERAGRPGQRLPGHRLPAPGPAAGDGGDPALHGRRRPPQDGPAHRRPGAGHRGPARVAGGGRAAAPAAGRGVAGPQHGLVRLRPAGAGARRRPPARRHPRGPPVDARGAVGPDPPPPRRARRGAARDRGDPLPAVGRGGGRHQPHPLHADRSGFDSYDELWRWSVDDLEAFWASMWDFFDVPGTRGADGARRAHHARRPLVPRTPS